MCADMPPPCAVSSSSARSRIPIFVAPGSCVATTSYPCSRSQIAVILACVVLPEPSPPSNAMNSPAGQWSMIVPLIPTVIAADADHIRL